MAGNSQRSHRALKSQRLLDPELSSLLTSKWPLQLTPANICPTSIRSGGLVAWCVKASLTLRRG